MDEIISIEKFAGIIEKLNNKGPSQFLFRGCGNVDYKLLPSLYRHKSVTSVADILDLEKKIFERFIVRCVPFLEKNYDTNSEKYWPFLFLMQHFGVPTRLLDWSENPYVALYFALTSANFDDKTKTYKQDAAFWILDAKSWNENVINKKQFYDGEILHPGSLYLNGYKPCTIMEHFQELPLAMFGDYNSQRIVAQRGAFTIFGSNLTGMEHIAEQKTELKSTLIKYTISKDNIPALLNSLLLIGITDSVVFPSLEGLSKELKRHFKFEVGYV
ncbi:MAG: FRG domain-containing protein [Leptospiraceae bacterium]|nr:FRG domain-containing protein [Leptospiraceae bacterium]